MRVFHASDCYAPRVGGVEAQIRGLALAQARQGHEVHVLTVEMGAAGERGGIIHDDDGLVIHRMGVKLPFRAPFNPVAARRTRKTIKDLKPDVVHIHAGTVSPFALGVAKTAVAEGIPVAATWHSMLDHAYPVLRPWAMAASWAGMPVAWSAVSRVAADHVARVVGADVGVLHNGLDLDAWVASNREMPTVPPLRCVATMRIVPSKRSAALIRIIALAQAELGPGALTLEVFGNGPDRWRLEREVRRHHLEHVVTLRGRTPRSELATAYARSHVFCAPATREAFGIAGLEARAAGLVVVARAGTGVEEFITDGQDGVLASTDNDFARELTRLARDSERLANLRNEALSSRPPFGIDRVVDAALAEYERAAVISASFARAMG